ncbi:MAG: DinB family protein [Gemmatimonadales bacterium]
MSFAEWFLPEFDQEMQTTRSLLERVPFDNASWRPHTKSTSLGGLASHVANLAGYGARVATEPEINFAPTGGAPYAPKEFSNRDELLQAFDANAARSRAAIAALPDQALGVAWSLKFGDRVIFTQPRGVVLRSFMMNHIIHHRGQLSVYLRLNDVPLPSIYGPTADT